MSKNQKKRRWKLVKMQKLPTGPEDVSWKLTFEIVCRWGFECLQIAKNALGQALNDPRLVHFIRCRDVHFIQCLDGCGFNLEELLEDPWLRQTWHEKENLQNTSMGTHI